MKNNTNKQFRFNLIIMILACIASIIFFVLFTINISRLIIDKSNSYEAVSATINRYEVIENFTYTYYDLYYEYIAIDGTIYTGLWQDRIANFDYVESKIGTTITIYVNNKLRKQRMDLDFRYDSLYFWGPLLMTSSIICIDAFLKVKKNYKNKI